MGGNGPGLYVKMIPANVVVDVVVDSVVVMTSGPSDNVKAGKMTLLVR